MLQTLLKRKTVRGRQRIGVVTGVVMAAAAAREFPGLADGAFRYPRVPLHFVDDVQIRIVHRGRRTRRRAVSITGPVTGISSSRHVHMVGDADTVLRRRTHAQATRQLHLLLLLLLHYIFHSATANILGFYVTVNHVYALCGNIST